MGSCPPGRPQPCANLVPNLVPTLCQPGGLVSEICFWSSNWPREKHGTACVLFVRDVWLGGLLSAHCHGPTRRNRTIVVEEPPPGPRGGRGSRWRPCEQAVTTVSGARFHRRSMRNAKSSPVGFSDNCSSFMAHDPSSSAQLRVLRFHSCPIDAATAKH